MDDTAKKFTQYVGRLVFPRSPSDLRSTTQCPACLTLLKSTVCHICGLDLAHPLAAQLALVSNRAADALDARADVIGEIRYDTATAAEAAAAAIAATATTAAPAPAPAQTTATAPPPAPGADRPIPTGPRRSSVQVILVVVGISLLSVFAIFGLVYAFINYGIAVRSTIIGLVTVASFVAASLLHRRGLRSTAEGLAALSVVLVYLDAWAIRVNDFFGAGQANGFVYLGLTLLVTGIGFVFWHRFSGLRLPSLAASIVVVPSVLFIVVGALDAVDTNGWTGFIATVAATIAGLSHRLVSWPATGDRRAIGGTLERSIVVALSGLMLGSAGVFLFFINVDAFWPVALASAGAAVVGFAHVFALTTLRPFAPSARVGAACFAAVSTIIALLAAPAIAVRSSNSSAGALVPVAVAVILWVLLEAGARRLPHEASRPAMFVGSVTAAVGAAIAAIAASASAAPGIAAVLRAHDPHWGLPPSAAVAAPQSAAWQGVLGLAAAVALLAVGWAILGLLRKRAHLLLWFGAAVAVLAVPLLRNLLAIELSYVVLAAIAVAGLIAFRTSPLRTRLPLFGLAAAATFISYWAGFGGTSTWWITIVSTIALLVAARWTIDTLYLRAPLVGIATIVALDGAYALGDRIGATGFAISAMLPVALLAGLLVAASSVTTIAVSAVERRVVFWISGLGSLFAVPFLLVAGRLEPGLRGPLGAIIGGTVVLVALVPWIARRSADFVPERVVASIAVAPLLGFILPAVVVLSHGPAIAADLIPMAAVILVTAIALVVGVLSTSSMVRLPLEAGAALLAFVLFIAPRGLNDTGWILLLATAAAVLLAAVSRDGLIGSTSPRRYLGWVALACATSALWIRLGQLDVQPVEPYVLPLAGALLVLALLLWRGGAAKSAPLLMLAGLAVGLLPIAAVSGSGDLTRPLAAGGVAAGLALVGSLWPRTPATTAYLDAATAVGLAGTLVVGAARSIHVLIDSGGSPTGELEAWGIPAVVIFFIAAFALVRARDGLTANRQRVEVAQALVGIALVGLALAEGSAADDTAIGSIRAVGLVLVLCAVHLVAFVIDRAPLTTAISWVAIALAGANAIVLGATDVIHPIEIGYLPVGLALLASGSIYLARVPEARSWAWFGPGLAVILLPSLVTLYTDHPVWRIVGVGVVAVALVVVGAARRLQAPFIIGVAVLLFHLVTQYWQGIRLVYESLPWWLWLGVAGVILVVLAARYEQRINNVKSVAMRVRALR
jgi:hypothetical protein